MAITDAQKVDYLYKKLGYGVAKTDTSTVKSPSNESVASPILIRGDTVWGQSDLVPNVAPASNTSVVTTYVGTRAIQTVNDGTASTNRTWKTNLTNWIGTEFGATYQPRVYSAPSGTANASATGTRLYPDGSGNNDSWFFDYQSGILNFSDTNVPTGVAGNVIFVEGYRYSGIVGVSNIPANADNILFSNTTITTSLTNGNITLTPTGTGLVYITGNTALSIPAGNTAQEPVGAPAGSIRYNSDISSIEFYNGTSWIQTTPTIDAQTIVPDGTNSTYTLTRSTTTSGTLVMLNGVMQLPSVAYTVSGTQITFAEIPLVTDVIDIRFVAAGEVNSSDLRANPNAVYVNGSGVTIDSFDVTLYRTAKYVVQVSDSANSVYQSSEILMTHDGTTPTISVYGSVYTGANLVGFTSAVSGGQALLKATSASANCAVKLQKIYIST